MKGRHKAGDTVLIEAKVIGVDEGNLTPIKEGAGADEKIIGWQGDTFVHIDVFGTQISVLGTKLNDPVESTIGVETGGSSLGTSGSSSGTSAPDAELGADS
jgi:hypothetical protein